MILLQLIKSKINDENKNDEYVYRVLCLDELYMEGIYLKDVNLNFSIEDYVLNGIYVIKLWFVLCCKIIDGVNELVRCICFDNKKCEVVKINISKFDFKEVIVIDLIDKNI